MNPDDPFAGKSETYDLCRRIEAARNRTELFAAFEDLQAHVNWLRRRGQDQGGADLDRDDFLAAKSEIERLRKRVADATDDDELFAALNQLTHYLTHVSKAPPGPNTVLT